MADATKDESEIESDPLRMSRFQAAYLRLLPEIERVDKHDLLVVNLDIPTVVMTVLGSISEIRKMRESCAALLPALDLALFERVEALALALGYTHSLVAAASVPLLSVNELSARAVQMRQMLAKDCAALAQRGLLDGGRLDELKGPVGYKNQAFDLLTLVALMRERWRRIKGKSAVSLAELDEAESVADQLLTAVGEREQLPEVTAAAAEIRRRAFTLFVRTHNELRRAAEYLRWHSGDADVFVPSLYPAKKRRAVIPAVAQEEAPAPVTSSITVETSANGAREPALNGDPFTVS